MRLLYDENFKNSYFLRILVEGSLPSRVRILNCCRLASAQRLLADDLQAKFNSSSSIALRMLRTLMYDQRPFAVSIRYWIR
jgi:hypothetical protein